MKIRFSMDGIKNMDLLYTWTPCHDDFLGDGHEEHYHGCEYCKAVIDDTISLLKGWKAAYQGAIGRVANEVFTIKHRKSHESHDFTVSFTISTYNKQIARLECAIEASETTEYDINAEKLKITLKNRLLDDWNLCTWLVDDQSVRLSKDAYEKASVVENNLRAFASKVLIHFLGTDWIKRAGLDKINESVSVLSASFTQRVPEFENINTIFLSMTLETLAEVMTQGKVYKEEIKLVRQDFKKIQDLGAKGTVPASNVYEFISKKREIEKDIWNDLFVPYLYNADGFKKSITDFISGRNHVAHSKVLSWNAYQIMISDFQRMDDFISKADEYFEESESSEEYYATVAAEEQEDDDYYRDRVASEAGLDILSESEIKDWFNEVVYNLYLRIYQQYHLDSVVELSEYRGLSNPNSCFEFQKKGTKTKGAKITTWSSEDGELGSDSECQVRCSKLKGKGLFSATIRFHNGNGYENEDGLMEPTEATTYDDEEIDKLYEKIIEYIENDFTVPAESEGVVK